jgi:hypothetical protein
MDADGSIKRGAVRLRKPHRLLTARQIEAHHDHAQDPGLPRTHDAGNHVIAQPLVVEVTVCIDQHRIYKALSVEANADRRWP